MDANDKIRLQRIIKEQRTQQVDVETESLREWLKCLEFLWESVGKKIDGNNEEDKRFDAYTRIFQNVPVGLLEPAIIRAISNNGKYNVIPTPGAIWDAMRKNLEIRPEEDILEVITNWAAVNFDKCVIRFEAK